MPINKNGAIGYNMPDNIRAMITKDFTTQFIKELHMIFGVGVDDTDMDYFVYQGGTSGWAVAFDTACEKLKLDELCRYYHSLAWYDSDIFDGELEDILVEHKLVVEGFLADEIARQYNLEKDDVVVCDRCGKYCNKNNIEKITVHYSPDKNIGLDEPFDDVEFVCKSCLGEENTTELTLDRNRMVQEILGKSPSDFFVCESCGKLHYNCHKGEEYCLYCETTDVINDRHANQYYTERYDESKKYRERVLLSEREE